MGAPGNRWELNSWTRVVLLRAQQLNKESLIQEPGTAWRLQAAKTSPLFTGNTRVRVAQVVSLVVVEQWAGWRSPHH